MGKALEFENDTVVAQDSVPNDDYEIRYRHSHACCRRRRRVNIDIPPTSPHILTDIVYVKLYVFGVTKKDIILATARLGTRMVFASPKIKKGKIGSQERKRQGQ